MDVKKEPENEGRGDLPPKWEYKPPQKNPDKQCVAWGWGELPKEEDNEPRNQPGRASTDP